MKTFTKALTTVVLTLSTIGAANAASKLVAADDYVTTKICVAAAGNNKMKLNSIIKDSGISKKHIVKNVTCNDLNILEFVQEYGEQPDKMNRSLTNGKYNPQVSITDLAAN